MSIYQTTQFVPTSVQLKAHGSWTRKDDFLIEIPKNKGSLSQVWFNIPVTPKPDVFCELCTRNLNETTASLYMHDKQMKLISLNE